VSINKPLIDWLRAAGRLDVPRNAAKGEFGEFTLARGRRLRSYFAKPQNCMSVTQCKARSVLCGVSVRVAIKTETFKLLNCFNVIRGRFMTSRVVCRPTSNICIFTQCSCHIYIELRRPHLVAAGFSAIATWQSSSSKHAHLWNVYFGRACYMPKHTRAADQLPLPPQSGDCYSTAKRRPDADGW